MSLSRIRDITQNAYERGQVWESSFRKTIALNIGSQWQDLSIQTGNPKANYYLGNPLAFTTLQAKDGLYHGGAVSPKTKYLHKILFGSSTQLALAPITFQLLDYVGFYPFIDLDSTDEQVFDNTTPLPRFDDGVGLQMMLVATTPGLGVGSFSVTYEDTNGVQRQTVVDVVNSASNGIGQIINAVDTSVVSRGPFMRLAPGSRGIRRPISITLLTPNGGLGALVLVKPLAVATYNETTAPAENDFIMTKLRPVALHDDAYLHLAMLSSGNWTGNSVTGLLTTIWN